MESKISDSQKEKYVQNALQKAMSYDEYIDLIIQHVDAGTNTGPEVNEALVNYTLLNQRRIKRWTKTFKLNDDDIAKIKRFKGDITWLVITESWCGDAAHTMPMMDKIAQLSDGIRLKVVLRDFCLNLMDAFLTNNARSIPKLIIVDNSTGAILGDWGPRPTTATGLVNDYKAAHGRLTPEFKQDLQVWYNKNKGRNTTEDLLALLS